MPTASRFACLPLAVLLSCGVLRSAEAEVVAHKSFSYFDISGDTADELDEALNAGGPAAMGASSRHPGATRIRFGGQATYVESGGRCHIGGARVTVDIVVILPRWRIAVTRSPVFPLSGTGCRPTSNATRSVMPRLRGCMRAAWRRPSSRCQQSGPAICCKTRSAANQCAIPSCTIRTRRGSTVSRLQTSRSACSASRNDDTAKNRKR